MSITRTAYAIDGFSPQLALRYDEDESYLGDFRIFQVTPIEGERDIEWRGAVVCDKAPGRAVCLPEAEYRTMRQAQLSNPQLREAYVNCNNRNNSDVLPEVILAATGGALITSILFLLFAK